MTDKAKILSEELKRFRQISEYDFYVPEANDEYENAKNLILGEDDPEGDEEENLDAANPPEGDEDMSDDLDASEDDSGDDMSDDDGLDGLGGDDSGEDALGGMEEPAPDAAMDAPMAEPAPPAEDEVELDVTQLVQGTEQAKQSSDRALGQITSLLQKFDELGNKLNSMDVITKKIEDLEQEIEKRNPTEKEKLEMRSLSSYPYNIKLTDYWETKDGKYDVMDGAEKEEDYVLTQKDVDSYSPIGIKDSFNDYEEEDV